MTYLVDLLNPPPQNTSDTHLYNFLNSQHEAVSALAYLKNDSVLFNSNFNSLGAKGLNPTTPADGDNFEFINNWFVHGSTAANYTITPTVYPSNSTIKSDSDHFVHLVVTSTTGAPFYFYQNQPVTVRKYQENYFTYGIIIKNNQSKMIKVRLDIYSYYDTGNVLKTGKPFNLQPGINKVASTILTDSLKGLTVGNANYTEFRLNFIDLYDGTADLELYQIKCEPGKISTPL